MFCVAAVLTAVIVHASVVESDYHPIGMYGDYRGRAVGSIYYSSHRSNSDFVVYYPEHTTVVALPFGKLTECTDAHFAKPRLPASDIERLQYDGRDYYLVTLSAQPHGTPAAGSLKCRIDFQARRESFTDYSMDVWFLPKPPKRAVAAATVNFSAIVEGAESMQVFGARSTSSSGADLIPDDEAVLSFTVVWLNGLRDVFLLLIGAFVALGAAMALEAIRPYVEGLAGRPQD